MLNVKVLKAQLQNGFENIIPVAIEKCKLNENDYTSKVATEKAKEFAETFKDLVCEPLAEIIAQSIDCYIKNASITGTLITNGAPTTHTANIKSMPTPMLNGVIPNTLGIK